jgi:uncharacterized membrane protein
MSQSSQPPLQTLSRATRRYHVTALALILLTAFATLAAYPELPSVVPAHVDGHTTFAPKWALFLYTPCLMVGIVSMFVALPWLSPKRFETNSIRPPYLYVLLVILSLLTYSQLLVLFSGLGGNVDVRHAVAGGLGLLLALLGIRLVATISKGKLEDSRKQTSH